MALTSRHYLRAFAPSPFAFALGIIPERKTARYRRPCSREKIAPGGMRRHDALARRFASKS
jgi:hypothetical protein